jgi:hypothetical protein
MSERAWAIATAVFGLIALGLFVAFALQPEMAVARDCLPAGSVIQFELARNADDLAVLFRAPDDACRPLAIAAMDAVNRLDMLAFIPAYMLFCICGALFLAGGALLRPLTAAAVGAAFLAGAADYLETTTLLAITRDLDGAEPLLAYSQFGAWAKFALLAAHGLFCAGLCYVSERRRTILGVLLVLPTFGVLAIAYDQVRFHAILNATFALAWLALWVFAIRRALQAKGA